MDAARGKWSGILKMLGLPPEALKDKHGPCPLCGGKDRFRFDNRDGSGSYICGHCGAGNGMDLLMKFKGWEFKQAAQEVDTVVGNAPVERVKPAIDPKKQRVRMADLWNSAKPIEAGDPVWLYLENRHIELPQNRDALRFHPQCPVPGEPGNRMAMLAKVSGSDGKSVQVHRTFLTPQGRKADMDCPRAIMPGAIPDGSAIRLAMHGDRLGIAEGIETALAATKRFGLPVWAAISSTMLKKWEAPEGVREITVFGDHDPKFGGQAAALALAHRLAVKGLEVRIEIPGFRIDPAQCGHDWADAA